MLKAIVRHPRLQTAVARAVSLYLGFALRTTRWKLVGAANLEPFMQGNPAIMAAWHERLALMPMQWIMIRKRTGGRMSRQRIHILISQSRDGRLITTVIGHFGVDVASGSSSRGGAAATRQLLQLLATGDHVGITPDGPRGPRRVANPGIARLAALSRVPILPCSAQTSNGWTLRTWDRMVVPRPFGRGVVVCEPAIHVDPADWRGAMPAIEAALSAAADSADRIARDRWAWSRLPG